MTTFTGIALLACILNIFFTIKLDSKWFGALGWIVATMLIMVDLLETI